MESALDIIGQHAAAGANLREAFFMKHAALVNNVALGMARALAAGGKILVCGNGGSAADSQHFAAELVGRFLMERPALPAIALTVDTSILTAVGNDYGFGEIFARQVRGLGRPGDILLGISTSGRSPNVLAALAAAKEMNMLTAGLCGGTGNMPPLCHRLISVEHESTPLVQEVHAAIIHLFCRLIDHYLFTNPGALEGEAGFPPFPA